MKCKHIKDDKQCGLNPKIGEEYCHHHQPKEVVRQLSDKGEVTKEEETLGTYKEEKDPISELTSLVKDLQNEIYELKHGQKDFKADDIPEDVEEFNKSVSPIYLEKVYKLLGKDIKVEFQQETSQIHIIIPKRLSNLDPKTLEIYDDEGVLKDTKTYQPEDRRSRVVRDARGVEIWCTLIRTNILEHFKTIGDIAKFNTD